MLPYPWQISGQPIPDILTGLLPKGIIRRPAAITILLLQLLLNHRRRYFTVILTVLLQLLLLHPGHRYCRHPAEERQQEQQHRQR